MILQTKGNNTLWDYIVKDWFVISMEIQIYVYILMRWKRGRHNGGKHGEGIMEEKEERWWSDDDVEWWVGGVVEVMMMLMMMIF